MYNNENDNLMVGFAPSDDTNFAKRKVTITRPVENMHAIFCNGLFDSFEIEQKVKENLINMAMVGEAFNRKFEGTRDLGIRPRSERKDLLLALGVFTASISDDNSLVSYSLEWWETLKG